MALMTAAAAREMTETAMSREAQQTMEDCEAAILSACQENRNYTSVSATRCHESVIKALQNAGYEVKFTSDQRDGAYYSIQW